MTRRQKILVASFAIASALMVGLVIWFGVGLNRGLNQLKPSKLLLDRSGHYLGEVPGHMGRRGYWPVENNLPEKVVLATVATEDKYYFHHEGVHLPSVLRALSQNLIHGRVISGASTIAMQVARLQNPGPRSMWRKAHEAAEAMLMVRDCGHDRVLRQYLTLAPYGNRVRGIARAARYYFNKPVEDLSWLQAAFLAGLPQAPGSMNPHSPAGLARAKQRAQRILSRLHGSGHLGADDLRQALASDLRLVPKPTRSREAMHVVLRLSEQARTRPALIQYSTIDLNFLDRAANAVSDNLRRLRRRGAGNSAALVVDRRSGEVLAYVGSGNYFDQEARGAIDYVRTRRPPGSALKPFIYALGLEHGNLTAATELPDIQVEFDRSHGVPYRPSNISHTFLGPLSARAALANSRNIPALQVLAMVGVEPALTFFEEAGVRQIDYDPEAYGLGLALGNLNVSLEELVGLYAVLANRGTTMDLRLFADAPVVPGRRLLSLGTADLIGHILADPLSRQPSFPRGTALEYDYAVSVKTGTSQGYRDGWAVAYSDRLVVGVWVGNHDWRRMNRIGGLTGAGVVVRRIMDELMVRFRLHEPVAEVARVPDGYTSRTVCSLSGKLAGPDCPHHRVEYFQPGSEPFDSCPYHHLVRLDRRNGLKANSACPDWAVVEQVMVDLPARYADWARKAKIEVAPTRESPLCGPPENGSGSHLAITEPRDGARFIWDPDTPAEYSTVKLSARVLPAEEDVLFLVDGVPVARVGYPHEFRWSLTPGVHSIRVALLDRPAMSKPITIVVKD